MNHHLMTMNMTIKTYHSKYNSRKTVVDGITFDSKKESKRYAELKVLVAAGEISNLTLQTKFEIIPKQKGERSASYKADFYYFDIRKNKWIVEDTKGFKTDAYILKRKLFKLKYPEIEFIES